LTGEHILVPHEWRRGLAITRVLLALLSLVYALWTPAPASGLIRLLIGLYLVYSIGILAWKNLQGLSRELLSLVVDGVFFLLVTMIAEGVGMWLSLAFFFYLMSAAVLLHAWQEVLLTGGIALIFCLLVKPEGASDLWPGFLLGGGLALLFSFQKRILIERLFHSSRQAVLYRSQSEKAREAERQRIAADFHDGPLQSFIGFQMRLAIVSRLLERDRDAAMGELMQLQALCRTQVAELRSFVRSMRPVSVDGASLTVTLSRLAETFQKDTGISTTFVGNGRLDNQEPEVATELLQIVREALHNVQKHSSASRVALGVEKATSALEIAIEDDGKGFPFSGAYSLDELELLRMGPNSIKRRVRALGGDMTLESRPGNGAGLKIRIPT
jgi:signal transduction histidine kinase